MVSESPMDEKDKTTEASNNPNTSSVHQVSHILDEVLEEPEEIPTRHNKLPLIIDFTLAFCLLLTMGAFAGLIKMYVSHSAEQSINGRNYQAAIALLEGAPFPDLFSPAGSEPRELLNQALYLDAIAKLDAYSEDGVALKELERIDASSRFFELAQEILKEHFKPSAIQLQGGATDMETSPNQAPVSNTAQNNQSELSNGQAYQAEDNSQKK